MILPMNTICLLRTYTNAICMEPPTKQFTWKELSLLNRPHNAHIAYKGKVYDASGFVQKHPGGSEQIMLGAGRDITYFFPSYHKQETSKLIEEKCKHVGYLIDNEMPTFEEDEGEFYKTVRKRVAQHFKSKGIDPKVNYKAFCRYIFFGVFAILTWIWSISYMSNSSWVVGLLLSAFSGFFTGMVTFTFSHDVNHFAVTHKPWVWRWSNTISDCIHGLSTFPWTYQHTFGHHTYTNIDGSDPDVVTPKSEPHFWRIKPFQKWFPLYLYQHLYMPFLYSIFSIKLRLQDFFTLYHLQTSTIRMNPPSRHQLVAFFNAKITHFVLRYIVPSVYVPLVAVIGMNLVYNLVFGWWVASVTQLNHINSDVVWPKQPQGNKYAKRWAENQVETTADYATDSWFWTFFTGALNHQVAHHLFPSVLQCYYPEITEIVKEACAEFGLEYRGIPTALEATRRHLGHLKELGKNQSLMTEQEQPDHHES